MRRLWLFLVLLVGACATVPSPSGTSPVDLSGKISADRTLRGTFRIRGELKVDSGAVLTLWPGTRLFFEPFDPDGDGINDSRLVVEGRIEARGTPEEPIIFGSASPTPAPGDWLELRLDRSEGSVFSHCVLEYSYYGLHVHFSSGVVADSILRRNVDATRFGNSTFVLSGNLIEGNVGKGVNLRASDIVLVHNTFLSNRHALFLFEEAGDVAVLENRFEDSELSDIRFGDFYSGPPPRLSGNFRPDGRSLSLEGLEALSPGGTTLSAPAAGPVRTGPSSLRVEVTEMWKRAVGGFVDAPPVQDGRGGLVVATWGGELVTLAPGDGRILGRAAAGDVVDAAPAFFPPDGRLYFTAWDRSIRALEPGTGTVRAVASWPESGADDHRQASPLAAEGGIVFGLWNGEFGLLNPATSSWRWKVALDGAIRGRPELVGGSFWVGTDAGSLHRVSLEGEAARILSLDSPLRTSPVGLGPGSLVVLSWGGVLYRVDAERVTWRRRLPGHGTYAAPILQENVLVGDGSGSVSCYFTGNGALLWRRDLGSPVQSLVPAQGMVWAGTEDGQLVALSPGTGAILARLQGDGAIHAGPLAVREPFEGVVWGARDGFVRAAQVLVNSGGWTWP